MKSAYALAALLASSAVGAQAATLLTNGDFEAGNTGFSTALTFNAGPNFAASQYDVDTRPNVWNGNFAVLGDHTTGSGRMMIVNGSTTPGLLVWSQTVTVSANTDYAFTGWIADLFSGKSTISLAINGTSLGQIVAPAKKGNWESFGFSWNSMAATTATISLLQVTTAFGGNDFALDDLAFVATSSPTPPSVVPLPAAGWALLSALGGLAWAGRARRRAA